MIWKMKGLYIVLSMKGWNSRAGVRRLPVKGSTQTLFLVWRFEFVFLEFQSCVYVCLRWRKRQPILTSVSMIFCTWRRKCSAWPGQSSSFWSRVLCSRQYLHLGESVGSLEFPLRKEQPQDLAWSNHSPLWWFQRCPDICTLFLGFFG